MIHHITGQDIIDEYIYEAYRRLYYNAVNEKCEIVPFDVIHLEESERYLTTKVKTKVYENYYSPDKEQREIIDALINEKYITERGTIKSLNKSEKQRVSIAVNLGTAPYSSLTGFLRIHPNFRKYAKGFNQD